jgi:hypothetical protein
MKKGIVTLLVMAGAAGAATVKLAWNANPAAEKVTAYEVKATEVASGTPVVVRSETTAAEVTGLKVGSPYFFTVRAQNEAGFSDYSPAIMSIPLPRYRVTIQKSDNLGRWTDTTTVLTGAANGAEFFRLKIELDDYQGVEP